MSRGRPGGPGVHSGAPPIEFIGAFESTYQPGFDVDVLETTGHVHRWREDLELMRASGVTRLRYPIRWHRIETAPGVFDWTATDAVLGYMQDNGFRPIVDLVHHTSYPRWLSGFTDDRYGPAFVRYVEAFARRYPWVPEYTLLNEPFTTAYLCGHEGLWTPCLRGLEGFLTLLRALLPSLVEASRRYKTLVPDARHVWIDTCERHTSGGPEGDDYTRLANDRRFFLLDVFLGRPLDPGRPFVAEVLAAGGHDLLALEPGRIDTLGLDYYAHNQWHFVSPGRSVRSSPVAGSLAALIVEYWERYQVPCLLGETNIRGFPSDRATWLKYTLEQCETARDAGVPFDGYCWFPFIDSADWASLLLRCDRQIDPVGVYWLDDRLERRDSSMSVAYAAAAQGAASAALPAYRLQDPVDTWLAGWVPQMSHWEWQPAPEHETRPAHHSGRDAAEAPTHPDDTPSSIMSRGAESA